MRLKTNEEIDREFAEGKVKVFLDGEQVMGERSRLTTYSFTKKYLLVTEHGTKVGEADDANEATVQAQEIANECLSTVYIWNTENDELFGTVNKKETVRKLTSNEKLATIRDAYNRLSEIEELLLFSGNEDFAELAEAVLDAEEECRFLITMYEGEEEQS